MPNQLAEFTGARPVAGPLQHAGGYREVGGRGDLKEVAANNLARREIGGVGETGTTIPRLDRTTAGWAD